MALEPRCTSGRQITAIGVTEHRPCNKPLVEKRYVNRRGVASVVLLCHHCDGPLSVRALRQ